MSQFTRSEMLLGAEGIKKLNNVSVAVFGIGGVGSYVCEALVRGGIGRLTFIDNDTISLSNINRQLIALHSTLGRYKTEVMRERALDINPNAEIKVINMFYTPENGDEIDFGEFDYIVDAIDTVTSKLFIIEKAYRQKIPVISSMGTGNKLDASRFRITDISKSSVCPLARVMRRELKKRNIEKLKVLWSDEKPLKPLFEEESNKRSTPGSVSFVPSAAGLLIAGEIIKDIINT